MSPPLLVLDGAPPSELKSGIVNSTGIRSRWEVLPSETKLTRRSGVSPILRNIFSTRFPTRNSANCECSSNYRRNINARISPDPYRDDVPAVGSSTVRHRRDNPNA